jgi:hypothetical protein
MRKTNSCSFITLYVRETATNTGVSDFPTAEIVGYNYAISAYKSYMRHNFKDLNFLLVKSFLFYSVYQLTCRPTSLTEANDCSRYILLHLYDFRHRL